MPKSLDRRSFLISSAALATLVAGPLPSCGRRHDEGPASIVRGVDTREAAAIRTLVGEFMRKYRVPGLALAMTQGGALKLVGAFGYADVDDRKPVHPDSLFRIASVSKPITSVTVLKLVERGRVSLDSRVFGPGGALRSHFEAASGTNEANRRRLESVTVKHLLEHACGGWGNSKNDPMSERAALAFGHDRLIRFTLRRRALEHDPGRHYDYSNFGYCLLGRVIEHATGRSYEESVTELVLSPSGIATMRLGRDRKEDRWPNEVVYVGQNEDPYNMRVTRMDAHGGWVASATDLVRFAIHVDGFDSPPDLLSPATLELMATPSEANPRYAKGWDVNQSNDRWHKGGFNGGAAILARISDGHCWAVVLNTRGRSAKFDGDLDELPWSLKRSIPRWGDHDLFREASTPSASSSAG